MRILISSKFLSDSLKLIDFDVETSIWVTLKDKNTLIIHTEYQQIEVQCEGSLKSNYNAKDEEPDAAVQRHKRWDFLHQLLSVIEDQPIYLDISHCHLSAEFIY